MEPFYARLKGGAPSGEALRSAQLDFIRGAGGATGSARSRPVHGSAREFVGDWK